MIIVNKPETDYVFLLNHLKNKNWELGNSYFLQNDKINTFFME